MGSFCKNEDCPPSQQLLAFQTGDVEPVEGAAIRRHLGICEFCAAEVEFYEHYPLDESGPVEPGEIPQPLYELAEALLNKKEEMASLYSLIDRE